MIGCRSIPTTPDTRTQAEKEADRDFAVAELNGDYDVVDSRVDFYSNRKKGSTKTIAIHASKDVLMLKINEGREDEWNIMASRCTGHNHKLATGLFCKDISSGMNFISVGKQKHSYQITSGAVITAFSPMDVKSDDYVLQIGESGNGRIHYYILKKR
ncbi:hypothetical protein [Comamonas sp. MYb69]|uniref:hypothetical protein n=1 Tax=Comamonas sp. MYb69 TaxID=1848650 RepID=UPI0030A5F6D8